MEMNSPLSKVFEGYESQIPFAFKEQFFASPERDYDVILEGIMQEIRYRPKWLKPLFWFLGKLGILVPRSGKNIPTTLAVVPGYFPDGRPFHEWNRTFAFDSPLKFNTTVIYDERMNNIADLVGPGRFLHMVWDGRFWPPDKFTLDTIANAIRIRGRVIYLPKWLWSFLFGKVRFVQQARDDGEKADVDLRIIHPMFGEVFCYRGTFRPVRIPKVDPRQP